MWLLLLYNAELSNWKSKTKYLPSAPYWKSLQTSAVGHRTGPLCWSIILVRSWEQMLSTPGALIRLMFTRGGETNFKGSGACDPGEVWGGPAVRSMLRHPKVKALIYSSLQLLHEERGIALSRPLQISQPIHSWDYCLIHLPFTGCLWRLPVLRGLQRPSEGFVASPDHCTEAY